VEPFDAEFSGNGEGVHILQLELYARRFQNNKQNYDKGLQ
jgi:hypothetical protein